MKPDECFRCGYCCKHYDISGSPKLVEEAERFGVPLKGPCGYIVQSDEGETACEIHDNKPSFCVFGPDFNNSSRELEQIFNEGREDFPACMILLIFPPIM